MIKKLLISVLLINLSGCIGYWHSVDAENLVGKADIDNDPHWYFGIGDARHTHPANGRKIYNNEKQWCGYTIWFVIPVPLLLPICRSFTEVTYENNKPVKRIDHFVKGSGYLCGPFVKLATTFDQGPSDWCSGKFQ